MELKPNHSLRYLNHDIFLVPSICLSMMHWGKEYLFRAGKVRWGKVVKLKKVDTDEGPSFRAVEDPNPTDVLTEDELFIRATEAESNASANEPRKEMLQAAPESSSTQQTQCDYESVSECELLEVASKTPPREKLSMTKVQPKVKYMPLGNKMKVKTSKVKSSV